MPDTLAQTVMQALVDHYAAIVCQIAGVLSILRLCSREPNRCKAHAALANIDPTASSDPLLHRWVSDDWYRCTPGHICPLPVHADQTVSAETHLITYFVCKSMLIHQCVQKQTWSNTPSSSACWSGLRRESVGASFPFKPRVSSFK